LVAISDVLSLADLFLGIVFRRLNDHLIASGLGCLLEEGDVSVQVAERCLLLQHESNALRGARLAGVLGQGWAHRQGKTNREAKSYRRREPNVLTFHIFLPKVASILVSANYA
jgi:hypothetical protein